MTCPYDHQRVNAVLNKRISTWTPDDFHTMMEFTRYLQLIPERLMEYRLEPPLGGMQCRKL